jgi:hypothetical protein
LSEAPLDAQEIKDHHSVKVDVTDPVFAMLDALGEEPL